MREKGTELRISIGTSTLASVCCSSTRQKLQNSKGYTESPEFSPVLGLVIFRENSVTTNLR